MLSRRWGFAFTALVAVALPDGVTARVKAQVAAHRLRAAAGRAHHSRSGTDAPRGIFGLVFVQDDPSGAVNSENLTDDEIADLAFEETRLQAENTQLHRQLDKENVTALREQVDAATKAKEKQEERAAEAEAQLTAADRSEVSEVDHMLQNLTADRIQLSAEERKEVTVGAHNAQLKKLKQDLEKLVTSTGQKLAAAKEAADRESAEKLKDLRSRHETALAGIAHQAEAKLDVLDSKLARSKRELQSLRTSSQSLRGREASLENETAILKPQASQLHQVYAEASKAQESLKQQLDAARAEHSGLSARNAEVQEAQQALADEDLDVRGMRVDVEAVTARNGLEGREMQELKAAKKELTALKKEYKEVLAEANTTRSSVREASREHRSLETQEDAAAESGRQLRTQKDDADASALAWKAEKEEDNKELQALRSSPEELTKSSLEADELREQLRAFKSTVASQGQVARMFHEGDVQASTTRQPTATDRASLYARQGLHADAAFERANAVLKEAGTDSQEGEENDAEQDDESDEMADKLMEGYSAKHSSD